MTTDAERLADWLEADACDLQTPRQAAALLRQQAAEIERLKVELNSLDKALRCEGWPLDDRVRRAEDMVANSSELNKANALLRQALEAISEAVELIGSDECTAKETLAAIKTHLGEV